MTTRGRAVAARVAHNHKVAGSSPAPATKIKSSSKDGVFILVQRLDENLMRQFCEPQVRRSVEKKRKHEVFSFQTSGAT